MQSPIIVLNFNATYFVAFFSLDNSTHSIMSWKQLVQS